MTPSAKAWRHCGLGAVVASLCAPISAGADESAGTAALQVALRAEGVFDGDVDGIAGPLTRSAVRRLQARHGLTVDGIAGPRTRRALGRRGRPRLGSRPLVQGARGWDVAALQFLLARQGFPSGTFDGGLAPRTAAALARPSATASARAAATRFHSGVNFTAGAGAPVSGFGSQIYRFGTFTTSKDPSGLGRPNFALTT